MMEMSSSLAGAVLSPGPAEVCAQQTTQQDTAMRYCASATAKETMAVRSSSIKLSAILRVCAARVYHLSPCYPLPHEGDVVTHCTLSLCTSASDIDFSDTALLELLRVSKAHSGASAALDRQWR